MLRGWKRRWTKLAIRALLIVSHSQASTEPARAQLLILSHSLASCLSYICFTFKHSELKLIQPLFHLLCVSNPLQRTRAITTLTPSRNQVWPVSPRAQPLLSSACLGHIQLWHPEGSKTTPLQPPCRFSQSLCFAPPQVSWPWQNAASTDAATSASSADRQQLAPRPCFPLFQLKHIKHQEEEEVLIW